MAPLFSKADLNKLWQDVQNEVTLIWAKFCKDLFNISKVIGRKTKWPRFSGLPCIFKQASIKSFYTVGKYMWVVCMNGLCHVYWVERVGGRSWCRQCVGLVTRVNKVWSAFSAICLKVKSCWLKLQLMERLDQFSQLFHCPKENWIRNKTYTILSTTPWASYRITSEKLVVHCKSQGE